MTSRPEPRTAEDRARPVVEEIFALPLGMNIEPAKTYLTEKIVTALREYGKAEFKRGCELFADGGYSHGNKEGYAQGFSDCRGKVMEILEPTELDDKSYERIRALTPSEGKES